MYLWHSLRQKNTVVCLSGIAYVRRTQLSVSLAQPTLGEHRCLCVWHSLRQKNTVVCVSGIAYARRIQLSVCLAQPTLEEHSCLCLWHSLRQDNTVVCVSGIAYVRITPLSVYLIQPMSPHCIGRYAQRTPLYVSLTQPTLGKHRCMCVWHSLRLENTVVCLSPHCGLTFVLVSLAPEGRHCPAVCMRIVYVCMV